MLCKSFSVTLHNLVNKWLKDLKTSSITFFFELIRLFVSYYARNKPLKKESYHLFSIIQNVDAFIKAFMNRF